MRVSLFLTFVVLLTSASPAQEDDLPERVRAVLETLDGNDETCDGEGVGGWTIRDLPGELKDSFRSLLDTDRASYYVLDLAAAKIAMTEHVAPPEDPIGFEMNVDWVRRGRKIVGIRMWGKCKAIERRMKIYLRLRFPDPGTGSALRSWKARLKEDGTYECRADLRGRELHYGHYYITGLADPRHVPDAGEKYVEREVTDRNGRTYNLYCLGFETDRLSHGDVQQISAEEVALKRFYVDVLDRNVLSIHEEFQKRYRGFMEGGEGLREQVVRGPEFTPGPVREEVQIIFDPLRWREFVDDEFRPFLQANVESLEKLREGYLAPRFPRVMDTLLLALRDLDETTRRQSQKLYEHHDLPPDPRDKARRFPNQPDPAAWQRRFDVSVLSLHRMGIREMSVAFLERRLAEAGWQPADLGVTVPSRDSAE